MGEAVLVLEQWACEKALFSPLNAAVHLKHLENKFHKMHFKM